MRRHHDMGGEPAGPIDRHEHDLAPWEKRVDAILRLLLAKGCSRSTSCGAASRSSGPAPMTS